MRIVALEEHVSLPGFAAELETKAPDQRGGRGGNPYKADLEDVHGTRLAAMDAAGITLQVLSVPGPGASLLSPEAGAEYTRRYNDALAVTVRERPDRFASFAHLPLSGPEAAADELERAVKECGLRGALISGTTHGKFLDDPSFSPLLSRAEQLDVPIYIHPGIPPDSVRKAYYDGYSPQLSQLFATAGWGWHAETAVHVLRMVLSGTFDRTSAAEDHHRPHGRMFADDARALRRFSRPESYRAAANGQPNDSRSRHDHDQRLLSPCRRFWPRC